MFITCTQCGNAYNRIRRTTCPNCGYSEKPIEDSGLIETEPTELTVSLVQCFVIGTDGKLHFMDNDQTTMCLQPVNPHPQFGKAGVPVCVECLIASDSLPDDYTLGDLVDNFPQTGAALDRAFNPAVDNPRDLDSSCEAPEDDYEITMDNLWCGICGAELVQLIDSGNDEVMYVCPNQDKPDHRIAHGRPSDYIEDQGTNNE